MHFTYAELMAMETIAKSQADNLKLEYQNCRIWLSRMSIGDCLPSTESEAPCRLATVEKYSQKDGWRKAEFYIAEGEDDGLDDLRQQVLEMEAA